MKWDHMPPPHTHTHSAPNLSFQSSDLPPWLLVRDLEKIAYSLSDLSVSTAGRVSGTEATWLGVAPHKRLQGCVCVCKLMCMSVFIIYHCFRPNLIFLH